MEAGKGKSRGFGLSQALESPVVQKGFYDDNGDIMSLVRCRNQSGNDDNHCEAQTTTRGGQTQLEWESVIRKRYG